MKDKYSAVEFFKYGVAMVNRAIMFNYFENEWPDSRPKKWTKSEESSWKHEKQNQIIPINSITPTKYDLFVQNTNRMNMWI